MVTQKQWADIVLDTSTLEQLSTIKDWLRNHNKDIIDISKTITAGYRALFYGPSGTGKSFTAALLGNELNMPVYRVDLSITTSKYIGETEKNLELLFKNAENKNWILFFEEADALFGKRTDVKDSNDRYANQEVSYLQQRIESFNGLVILASNLRSNIDEAFKRRLQSVIYFPPPDARQRKRLWLLGLTGIELVEEKVDLDAISTQFELSPASIITISHAVNEKATAAAASYEMLVNEIKTEAARQSKKQSLADH